MNCHRCYRDAAWPKSLKEIGGGLFRINHLLARRTAFAHGNAIQFEQCVVAVGSPDQTHRLSAVCLAWIRSNLAAHGLYCRRGRADARESVHLRAVSPLFIVR